MAQDLKALAKEQMGRMSAFGVSDALAQVPRQLAEDEHVDFVFSGEFRGKRSVLVLTDRRLLVCYGLLGKSDSIMYEAINQIDTGIVSKVQVRGPNVDLALKVIGRKDAFVQELTRRRNPAQLGSVTTTKGLRADASGDPVQLLARLGELRDAGVLSEEEFAAKKAELLNRM